MTFAFIREGDRSSHGGTVLSSGASTHVGDIPIAYIGTMVSCPKCGGVYPIVTSMNPFMSFNGRQAAFEGDRTACGATLISSQSMTKALVPAGSGTAAGAGTTAEHMTEDAGKSYRGRFRVLDAEGKPAAGHPYTLKTADGATISGTTDGNGYTQWHEAESPASLQFNHGSQGT